MPFSSSARRRRPIWAQLLDDPSGTHPRGPLLPGGALLIWYPSLSVEVFDPFGKGSGVVPLMYTQSKEHWLGGVYAIRATYLLPLYTSSPTTLLPLSYFLDYMVVVDNYLLRS